MKTKLIILACAALAASANAQLVPQTQLETDLFSLNRAANGTTYYGQLLVKSLNNAHSAVWGLPDERLAAVLDHLGPETVTALVALQSSTAAALNQSLDAAGDTGPRATVDPSREFSWNGDSVVIVPLPVVSEP